MNERSDRFIALLIIGIFVVLAVPSFYVVQGTMTGYSVADVMAEHTIDVPLLLGAAMIVLLVMALIQRFSAGSDEAHIAFTRFAERNEKIDESAHQLKSFVAKELKSGKRAKHIRKTLQKHGWKKQTAEKYIAHAQPKVRAVVKEHKNVQERKELPLSPQMIDSFVKTSLRNGASVDDIRRVLLGKGWSREQVQGIVSKISKKSKVSETTSYDHELPMIEKELQKLSQGRGL